MRRLAIAAMLTFAAAMPASAATKTCPIEKTVYRLTGFEKSATLRFIDDPALARQTHLSAVLTSNVTGKTYRYSIAVSNGYSNHYLVDANRVPKATESDDERTEAENKAASFSFFSFDAGLHKMNLPNPGTRGPAFIFIPDIGGTLWYAELSPGQKAREAIETEMWKPAQCLKQKHWQFDGAAEERG